MPHATCKPLILEQARMGWKHPIIGIHMRLGVDKNREAQVSPFRVVASVLSLAVSALHVRLGVHKKQWLECHCAYKNNDLHAMK